MNLSFSAAPRLVQMGTSDAYVVAVAQIVDPQVCVVLLAAVEVVVGRGAGLGEAVAVGVVLVRVGRVSVVVGELANVAAAIVPVKARRPCAVEHLFFVDPLPAVGVGARDLACAVQLVEDLWQPGGVDVVLDKVARNGAVDRLRHAFAKGAFYVKTRRL